jgi:hypothetical protein
MPVLPANFPSRGELRRLLLLADGLLRETDHPELAFGLRQVLAGVAYLEGFLSEAETDAAPPVSSGPDGWSSEWVENSLALHTRGGLFRILCARQFLRCPAAGVVVPTGRYRLTLGTDEDQEVHVSVDRQLLRGALLSYLDRFRGVLPAGTEERCLRFFLRDGEGGDKEAAGRGEG